MPPMTDPYVRTCEVLRVIDGDTIDLRIDLGYRCTSEQRIRLLGIDTPELHSERADEREAAAAARSFTRAWLSQVWLNAAQLVIRSEKGDSFGRWLGEIRRDDVTESLNEALIAAGHATRWPTRWHETHPIPEQEPPDA